MAHARTQISLAGMILVVTMAGFAYQGYRKYREFTAMSIERVCFANRTSIDKCVGVWESQFVALTPTAEPLWLELDTSGKIVRDRLAPGGEILFKYTRDYNVFRCVMRVAQTGGEFPTPETHYRWVYGKSRQDDLDGRTRGTRCLVHVPPASY
jgi:hypothetical protein